jgi:16S rRNA (guanine527-N7)-methyltransferase
LTARALAPLPRLLELAAPLLGAKTELWLWKGQDVEAELTEAARYWNMRIERHRSISDPTGTILHLRELSRA